MTDENQPTSLPLPTGGFSLPVPFPDSYWILPRLFLAGEYPGSLEETKTLLKLKSLDHSGIRHIVDLTEAGECRYSPIPLRRYDHLLTQIDSMVSWVRFPIPDQGTVPEDSIKKILDHVDRHLAREIPTYVHCWGGHGRTGLVVGCWLARHGYGMKDGVLSLLEKLRREMPDGKKPSPETPDQRRIVQYWKHGQ
jgi:predicted protein tyrosine phosphatase